MGFHTGAYATVWEIKETGSKFSKIRISTSRKDKESDEYVTDFNGFVSMVGDANKNINLISDALEGGGRCRIKIGSCDVSNRYDKEAGREYTNFAMFDFEMADGSKDSGKSAGKPAKKKQQKGKPASPLADEESDDDDENLPF